MTAGRPWARVTHRHRRLGGGPGRYCGVNQCGGRIDRNRGWAVAAANEVVEYGGHISTGKPRFHLDRGTLLTMCIKDA